MIHHTAIIDKNSKISEDVEIGPYCVIGSEVEIASNSKLHSHVSIKGNTKIGKNNEIFAGFELFIKYLGWLMIPSFVLFLPLGFILFLKKRPKEMNFILIFLISSSIPILYAYIVQAQDTRYFYFLYPIFILISLFTIEKIISKVFTEPSMPFLVEQKLNQGKLGEVILNALLQFEMGIEGNLKDFSESLSTLNLIGLETIARRAALTHLVIDK